jgi:hypothetical protein
MQETNDIVVDAVITWVDGNDPVHKAKMANYIENKTSLNSKSVRMRYDQVNEIEFAVKSILKYAKFVRNIFIVTDNQTPDFLKDKEKAKKDYPTVFVIDHKTIFEGHQDFLPTFNSMSIETLLYKISNLSEHFIYLNDDMSLINETKVSDFFKDGFPVLRGAWIHQSENISTQKMFKKKKDVDTLLHRNGKQNAARLIGLKKIYNIHHAPYPLRKSTFENYFKENKDVLIDNIKYKFRDFNQFIPQVLANHLEFKNNTCIQEKNISIVYIHSYNIFKLFKKFFRASFDKNRLFMCLQSLDQCSKLKLTFIQYWLHKKYN